MITLYGLKNCDTCRKARKFLEAEGIEHRFHDLRADGLAATDLKSWVSAVGWEKLLNRRGTTWRGLPDKDKNELGEAAAIELMRAHPALIKRPVIDQAGEVSVGFGPAEQKALKKAS